MSRQPGAVLLATSNSAGVNGQKAASSEGAPLSASPDLGPIGLGGLTEDCKDKSFALDVVAYILKGLHDATILDAACLHLWRQLRSHHKSFSSRVKLCQG